MTFGDVFGQRGSGGGRGETGGNDVASVAVTKDGRGRRGGYDKAMV